MSPSEVAADIFLALFAIYVVGIFWYLWTGGPDGPFS